MKNHYFRAFCKKTSISAFTLIELLAVTVAVLILTGITFGVSRGVLNQQARAQAKAELAMIVQALEEFKLTYGDYPVASEDNPVTTSANAKQLTWALTGFLYLEPGTTQGTRVMTEVDNSKSFIDTEKMNFSEDFGDPETFAELNEDSFLVDPWRQPYVYVYNKGADTNSWDNIGYVLFSKGPDKNANLTNGEIGDFRDDGIIDQTHRQHADNIDNIYPGE